MARIGRQARRRTAGSKQIWRSDPEGRNAQILTHEEHDISTPQVGSDSQSVYFNKYDNGQWKIAAISADGGESRTIVDENAELWSVSPDSARIAYTFWDESAKKLQVAIKVLSGEQREAVVDISPIEILQWSDNGDSLIYQQSDAENNMLAALWQRPLGERAVPTRITVSALKNYYLARSRAGSEFAFIRGKEVLSSAMLERDKH